MDFNLESTMFHSRGDAQEVLNSLEEILRLYDIVTVKDLYDLSGIDATYTDNRYGWKELKDVSVVWDRDGYIVKMPKPQLIGEEVMKFVVGKFYRNGNGKEFSVLCKQVTTFNGECLIAETNDGQTLVVLKENGTADFEEISKSEWMKNVSWEDRITNRRK